MKIQISLSNKEKETINSLFKEKHIRENLSGRWGYIKDNEMFIQENCICDFITISSALLDKFKNLFEFIQKLVPVIKDVVNKFKEAWISDAMINDIPLSEFDEDAIDDNEESEVEEDAGTSTTKTTGKKKKTAKK